MRNCSRTRSRPGDLLGHRVLDLQARVHLEERDGAVRADEELAGARADVADLLQDRLRRRVEQVALRVGEERRRRLLDELLVAALQRAVAGRHDDDVAERVREALRLDVARLVEVLLDEALAAAERGDGLAGRRLELLGDLLHRARDLQAAPAAAERGLDGDRQADLARRTRRPRRRRATGFSVPGASGAPTDSATWRAVTLSPSASIAAGDGPIQIRPASITACAKALFSARKP